MINLFKKFRHLNRNPCSIWKNLYLGNFYADYNIAKWTTIAAIAFAA